SYPVTLCPLNVVTAELQHPPFRVPDLARSAETKAVVHLTLESFGTKLPLAELEGCDFLRFFLHGQSGHVHALYELLFNNALGLAVARSATDDAPLWMNPDCIRPVGFEIPDGVLPYSAQSFLGYRLLTEYFCFPEKFLFVEFDLRQMSPTFRKSLGERLELYVPLDAEHIDLERNVTSDTFRLGCTPIVNLFRQRSESIPMKQHTTEYRVIPDSRRPLALEVYSIDAVRATSPAQDVVEYRPFHSFQHAAAGRDQQTFWQAARRRATSFGPTADSGTEVYLQLVDLQQSTQSPTDWILDVETTCLNRDLPHRLPFGGDEPRLHLEKGGPVTQIHCLTQPTPTRRAPLRHGTLWRLISHLSLNHLSLCDSEQGADALREILTLYDYVASDVSRASIDGVQNISYRPAVGRVDQGPTGGLCRGLEVTVDFDEERYTGGGVYLLMCVLDRFLGLSCSVNSFTRFVATTNQRERPIKKWPPRSGTRVLL
ncbi:MAG: type VI secretion system baseplate subunit TssF, partial [Planctomycetaceae bacterium]